MDQNRLKELIQTQSGVLAPTLVFTSGTIEAIEFGSGLKHRTTTWPRQSHNGTPAS